MHNYVFAKLCFATQHVDYSYASYFFTRDIARVVSQLTSNAAFWLIKNTGFG